MSKRYLITRTGERVSRAHYLVHLEKCAQAYEDTALRFPFGGVSNKADAIRAEAARIRKEKD